MTSYLRGKPPSPPPFFMCPGDPLTLERGAIERLLALKYGCKCFRRTVTRAVLSSRGRSSIGVDFLKFRIYKYIFSMSNWKGSASSWRMFGADFSRSSRISVKRRAALLYFSLDYDNLSCNSL
jgi:hypothetical protein